MPLDPPAVPTTAGRDPGADAVGGGSGALWMDDRRCDTEPVASFEDTWACGRKILSDSKRWVSELQLTAATEIDANTARRNKRSERPGSSTQRIGFPTRTQLDNRGVNSERVNNRLSRQQSFNPNQSNKA
jgi:hypothetical protein